MKKIFIKDFEVNQKIDSCFLLRKKNLKLTKADKPYLELTFSDKTGNIEGRLWDDAEKYFEIAETGDIVKTRSIVTEFKGDKQLKVDSFFKADDDDFVYEDMVRVADNRDQIFANIIEMLNGVENEWIKKLALKFTGDEKFVKLFSEGVGGKSWHNAYIGGLMEHTYEVMSVANKVCSLYPEADKSVTIFGSFLHDVGKIEEIDPRKMEYTIEGGLLGHIAIGYKILQDKIKLIEGFPQELAIRLSHIILSHHGEYEQQSPVLPKTLEAVIVYQTDELVSQANAIKEIKANERGEGKVWSNYVSIKNRKFFIKDEFSESWKNPDTSKTEVEEDLFG